MMLSSDQMKIELNQTPTSVCNIADKQVNLGQRYFKYEATAWDAETFLNYTAPAQKNKEWIEGRIRELKEDVRALLALTIDNVELVNLIDTIEHLGIGYHFKGEIDDALRKLHDVKLDSCDLHTVATRFRLLRQHRFIVSSDEFLIFKDHAGNFREKLQKDPKGLLSLYNAGYLEYPGENMLDDAVSFCRNHLTSMVDELKAPLSNQGKRALKTPLHRMIVRVEARYYIEEYEKEEHHNKILLELAKLDFNLLQSLYLEEMKDLLIWWKELNIRDNLKYARDHLLECFAFWALGLYFEPEYFRARFMATKILSLLTLADDTFDICGTYEDCKLLNEAVQRWDEKAEDILQMYLRGFYLDFINTINCFEDELEDDEKYCMPYLIEAIQTLIDGYMQEVEWQARGCVPSFNDRKATALDGSISTLVVAVPFVGLPGEIISKEAFQWLTTIPSVVVDCMSIIGYIDELVTFERESKAQQGSTTIKCYMIEHNLTNEAASVKFQSFCEDAWKRLNQACLQPADHGAVPVLDRLINNARLMVTLYLQFNDGFNKCSNVKEIIDLLLLKPFPL